MYRFGSLSFQHSGNIALVLRALRDNPGLTRSQLADDLHLDRSTISNITGSLIQDGVIREGKSGDAGPRGGRRPISLQINNERICALGIEIEPELYRAVVIDAANRLVFQEERALTGTQPVEEIELRAGEICEDLIRRGTPIVGVGYGIPGSVEPIKGRIIRSRALAISDLHLRPDLEVSLPGNVRTYIPVAVDNDANCCALGELHSARQGDTPADLVFILARRTQNHLGVGLGVIINGHIHYTGGAQTSEFYTSRWSGDPLSQTSLNHDELVHSISDKALWKRLVREILDSAAPIISVVNPGVICVGGEFREKIQEIDSIISDEMTGTYLESTMNRREFRVSAHGDNEVAVGAAGMVLERLFSIPHYDRVMDPFRVSWDRVLPLLRHMYGGDLVQK